MQDDAGTDTLAGGAGDDRLFGNGHDALYVFGGLRGAIERFEIALRPSSPTARSSRSRYPHRRAPGRHHPAVLDALGLRAAGRVEVQLRRVAGALRLKLADDGRGCDPNAATGGYGLPGIRERAQSFGGRALIDSVPGGGLRIRVWLPLDD